MKRTTNGRRAILSGLVDFGHKPEEMIKKEEKYREQKHDLGKDDRHRRRHMAHKVKGKGKGWDGDLSSSKGYKSSGKEVQERTFVDVRRDILKRDEQMRQHMATQRENKGKECTEDFYSSKDHLEVRNDYVVPFFYVEFSTSQQICTDRGTSRTVL